MDKYFKSEKNTENSFHRLIQPVNVYTNLRRTSLTPYANEIIHYDGTISIFKLIGLRPILVAMARQSVQLVSEEVIETRNFFKESYARALPYKHIFFEWVTRVFLNLRRIVFSYSINHKNADQVQIYDTAIENSYHDNNEQDSENYDDRFDDYDSHSILQKLLH
uniref:Uncharacterized protein n=1 Tax=Panagrolaimus superbus TaxID=310955 RepID=A0A914Y7E3_9BILA